MDNKESKELNEIFTTFLINTKNKRSRNIVTTCKITKQQARTGLIKIITINVVNICNCCGGTGKKEEYKTGECKACKGARVVQEETDTIVGTIKLKTICDNCKCKNCNGIGFVYNKKDVVITIPPKTKNNDYIILKGQGNKFIRNQKKRKHICKSTYFGR